MKPIAAAILLLCSSCVSEPLPDEVKIADVFEQKAIDAAAANYELAIKEMGVELKRLSNLATWNDFKATVTESRPTSGFTTAEVLILMKEFEAKRIADEAAFDAIIDAALAKNEAKKASELHRAKSEYLMAVDEQARKIRDLVSKLTGGIK